MEQRPLRLGDIVDDYCPRERRVTNHAIVAIVEDAIRQTRCTTCDTEHPFKGGQEPRRRLRPMLSRPAAPGALLDVEASAAPAEVERLQAPAVPVTSSVEVVASPNPPDASREPSDAIVEAWTHRRLIRATLPKNDSEPPPPRPIPEFTMHQRPVGRGARGHRPDHGRPVEQFRGRPLRGNPNGSVETEDEDEVNGNVIGPIPFSRNGQNGQNHQAQPSGGRRRRGRRRRGR